MRPHVIFSFVLLLAVLGIAIFMVIPTTPVGGNEAQQQTLAAVATSVDRDMGVIQDGSVFCGPIMGNDDQGVILGVTNMDNEWPLATSANLDNSSSAINLDSTTAMDINKGVLANAGADVQGSNMNDQTGNVMAAINVPIDKSTMNDEVLCNQIPIGLDPDGGRAAQIMANSNSIIGPDGGRAILTS